MRADNYGTRACWRRRELNTACTTTISGDGVGEQAGSNFTLNDAASVVGSGSSLFVNDAGRRSRRRGEHESRGLVVYEQRECRGAGGDAGAQGLYYNGTGTATVAAGAVLQLNGVTVGDGVVVTGNGMTLLTGTETLAGRCGCRTRIWRSP